MLFGSTESFSAGEAGRAIGRIIRGAGEAGRAMGSIGGAGEPGRAMGSIGGAWEAGRGIGRSTRGAGEAGRGMGSIGGGRKAGRSHHGQHRRSRHGLHLPGVEAAELLGQCDGGALVAAQHDEAAGEAAVGDAEVGVLGAEFVRLARGVGELGDAEVVAVGGVLVLPREAGRLGLRTTASGEEERIAGVGMKRTARRVVRATARRRRWPDLAGLMGRRRRRPEARE